MNCKKVVFISLVILALIVGGYKVHGNSEPQKEGLILIDYDNKALVDRLKLDPQFSFIVEDEVPSDLNAFDLIVIVDFLPKSSIDIQKLVDFNGGILTFIGRTTAENTTLVRSLGLTSDMTGSINTEYALPIPANETHDIIDNIAWNSVPTIKNYTTLNFGGKVLIDASIQGVSNGVALVIDFAEENVMVINIDAQETINKEFVGWPYFNYMLYLCMKNLVNEEVLNYAQWPYSPVPHLKETIFIGAMVVTAITITTFGFIFARNYAKNNPISQKDLDEMKKDIKVEKDWYDVGMHRQLAGFLVQLFFGLLIILPNVIMSALIFPLFVLPSPQFAGFYDYTVRFFEALWLLFDLGTSIILIKFFSEHRVKSPQQAVKYVQIFIWYQMCSGVFQLFLISFLGSIFFPQTFLAHMTWVFVTHAFFQWPAFFIVFKLFFAAMNRHDLFQILNLLLFAILNITLQYLVIILFRFTLGQNPMFGDGMAGVIGYSVGNYVIQATVFLIGMWMYKRLGFSLKSIFRIDFGWAEIKEAFLFGIKWTVGNILPPFGWFFQLFLLSLFLPNYTQQQGYFGLAFNFAMIVMLVTLFAQSMLSGVSESFHAKKRTLTQYYTLSSLKWGAFFGWFFVAALLTIGARFILGGAGQEWAGAAILIPWFLLFHFFGYPSWVGDQMLAGSNRPGWASISWILEQTLRAGLLLLFIPQHAFFTQNFGSPMVAVMFAYIPALIIKNTFMWIVIRRYDQFKFPLKDLVWQGLAAPLLSAIALFGLLELLFSFMWQGEIFTSVLILVLGTIGGFYVYAFFGGFFGVFDDKTLKEFHRATKMARGVQFMSKPLYQLALLGTKISFLHNKFKISIYDDAIKEAEELTSEKVDLAL